MKYIVILMGCAILFTACKKIDVDGPSIDVSVPRLTYKAKDTVNFKIQSNAENIVFYSGELGSNYDFRDRTVADGLIQLQFTSYLQNKGELNTLQLLASTNFNGIANAANIASANWTDITSRATLSTGSDNTASGTVDISDFKNTDKKPLYLAFRYVGYNSSTLKQPTWTIKTFNVNNVLSDGRIYPLNTIDKTGWAGVDLKNPSVTWSIASTGIATINGTISGSTSEDNEDWLISKALNLNLVGKDTGVSIQNLSTAKIETYKYIFNTPGTYKVSFLAFNNSIDSQKNAIKQFTITVTP